MTLRVGVNGSTELAERPHPYTSLGDARQSRGGVYPRPKRL
jgi:hypothetical protein